MSAPIPTRLTLDIDLPQERPAVPVGIPTTTAGVQVTKRDSVLLGYTFRETTGSAAAVVRVVDGFAATGQLIAAIALVQGTSVEISLAPNGLLIKSGIYIDVASGSIEGSVWVRWERGDED